MQCCVFKFMQFAKVKNDNFDLLSGTIKSSISQNSPAKLFEDRPPQSVYTLSTFGIQPQSLRKIQKDFERLKTFLLAGLSLTRTTRYVLHFISQGKSERKHFPKARLITIPKTKLSSKSVYTTIPHI